MDRRRFLAGTGTAALASLAGCTVAGSPVAGKVDLGEPKRERDGPDETYLHYHRDGERVLTVGLDARDEHLGPDAGRYPFQLHVWHADGLQTKRLRYVIRFPTGPNGPFVDLSYERPDGGPWPAVTFERGDDLGVTIFEMADIGFVGQGSITLDFAAEPGGDRSTLPMTVDALVALSGGGFGRYVAEGDLEHEFPTPEGEQP